MTTLKQLTITKTDSGFTGSMEIENDYGTIQVAIDNVGAKSILVACCPAMNIAAKQAVDRFTSVPVIIDIR
jgi:hypothetical protein